jgi:uncharacterized membrane protein YedE/YeeE
VKDLLADPPGWYVAGPVLGLCVVVLRAALNERLGVTGGFSEVIERATGRRDHFGWRSWFLFGLVAGGLAFALLAGASRPEEGYGWLTDTFSGAGGVLVALILLASGVLIGFGAKTAGGCTSGNGLSGSSLGSRASMLATATFFATAIVVAFAIKAVT